MQEACARDSPRRDQRFEVGVFCGDYITPVEEDYLKTLQNTRNTGKKPEGLEELEQVVGKKLTGSCGSIEAAGSFKYSDVGDSDSQDVGLYNLNRNGS